MPIKKLIIALFCLQVAIHCAAQNGTYYFNHLKVEDGLTQNTVWCMLQDQQGFMWFGTKDGLNRYDGYRFKIFRHDPSNPKSIGNNFIRSLYLASDGQIWVGTDAGLYIYNPNDESFTPFKVKTANGYSICKEVNDIKADQMGNIWIGVNWQGLFCYNKKKDLLTLYQADDKHKNTLSSNSVWSICIDLDGTVWVGTLGGGLNMINPKRNIIEHYMVQTNGNPDDIYKIIEDGPISILVGTMSGGVYSFNRVTHSFTPFITGGNKSLFVRDIFLGNKNEIWLGTESGLFIYSKDKKTTLQIRQVFGDKYALSCNAIYSIFKDKDEGMWIGTYFGGVNYLSRQNNSFEKHYPSSSSNGLSGKAVRELCEDSNGNIWIGTEDNGLNCFNPTTKQFKQYLPSNSKISYTNIHGLLLDGDELWIGYFTKGLDIFNIKTGAIRHISHTSSPLSISDNNAFSFCKDRQNNIWIGTISGLNYYDRKKNTIEHIMNVGSKTFIYDIIEDSRGLMWFGTYGNGVYCFNPRTKEWSNFRSQKNNPNSLGFDKIIGLFEDSKGNIWMSTEGGGVSVYNFKNGHFKSYNSRNGLPNDVVYKTLEDNNGFIWLSTNKGLARFNPKNGTFKLYTNSNGLINDQFNYKSGIKTRNGKLLFGTINGFVFFDPSKIEQDHHVPPIVLTGFQVYNTEVQVSGRSPLEQSITLAHKIRLKHNQNTFSFDFAALSYNASEMNQYAYKMENYDKEWTYITKNQKVTYPNMPPGKYVFKVKGANSDGVWNKEGISIEVVVRPPFWLSTVAIILYLLLTAYLSYYAINRYKSKIYAKHAERIDRMRIAKEKAVQQAKIEFFTNIAHEIRTPLTLIKGPYEQILKADIEAKDYQENLKIMGWNIDRLLNLINQLLDFRKIESNNFQIEKEPTAMVTLCEEVFQSFKPIAKQKGIALHKKIAHESFIADVDPEAMTKIITNLLSNAIKFAKTSITLELKHYRGEDGKFTISVRNDGKPITPEYRSRIFEPFFQIHSDEVKSGTGLGLSMVKYLVEQHKGTVEVQEGENEETCFTISIPIASSATYGEHPTNAEVEAAAPSATESVLDADEEETSDNECILIVEDDLPMRKFLKNILGKKYSIVEAEDGEMALKMLQEYSVDLVVSDVMMPKMDGYEFCSKLKNNVEYSHIPVILLTAKVSTNSKIEGLQSGADAFIEKPFSTDHLLTQIDNLLTNRTLLRQTFLSSPKSNVKSIATSKADEAFLEKINDLIHKNISNESFGVDQLAEMLNMSRSSLHRKIKGVSKLTPNDYIRLIKLKRAVELLEEGTYRVNEICYIVGFSSPSYFAKCFQKQFGMLPKDFVKQSS